jgi:hypothetical protein
MSTRSISWGVKLAGTWVWEPYDLHVPIVSNSESLNLLEPSGRVIILLNAFNWIDENVFVNK